MATDSDIEFRASDLIGHAGVGSNGERLVNTLLDHYPPELQAALLKRINPELDAKLDDKAHESIARIAGVKQVAAAHVRGGDLNSEDAVVTYVWLDEQGTVWKGCFPYGDLGSRSSDGHVSQRDSLARSATARQHIAEHPRQAADAPAGQQADPYDALEGASADELVAQMRAHPERVEAIKAFERAVRGKTARKSVLEFESESFAAPGAEGQTAGPAGQSS